MQTIWQRTRTWNRAILLLLVSVFALNADQAGFQAFATYLANSGGTIAKSQTMRSLPPISFADKLAAAALERTNHFVIYNPKYMKIGYPNGDVPSFFGVCTDVVIRAYRSLGVDLQSEVHKRLGGDRNIAHRRVNTLRRFFGRYGQSLKITKNPANYKPGDIVTYYIPGGRFSTTHIAVVSSRKTLFGRPMIVHNIGFGPQLEDALFDFKITGHYRYLPTLRRKSPKKPHTTRHKKRKR